MASCLLVLACLQGIPAASAVPVGVEAKPAILTVYQDGTVAVNQTMTLADNVSVIYVPMFASQVGDILVLDQSGGPVNYQLSDSNMTVYSLGDTEIVVTYNTEMLTSKNGSAWTISFTTSFNATVILPMGSTILSLSGLPISTSVQESSPVISVSPGSWSIGYGLSLSSETLQSSTFSTSSVTPSSSVSPTSSATSTATATSTSTSHAASVFTSSSVVSTSSATTQRTSQTGSASQASSYLIAAVVLAVVVVAAVVVLAFRRQRRGASTLRPDDIEVLRFIRDRGGKVTEVEIRQRFSLPRTSSWRQVKRLEQMQYVRVTKQGQQNLVELLKDGF